MKAASLIRWSALEETRRKRALGGFWALPDLVTSLVFGLLLGGEVLRRLLMASDAEMGAVAVSTSEVWVAAAVCGYSIAVFGAPFRLYWRRDSKLLASLPVPGSSLFALAIWRSHRSALQITMSLLVALIPIGLLLDWELAMRHVVALVVGFVGASWLGPAAALGAGAIVASDKAQAMIASMGGEFQAPRTTWLGLMPGLAATAVAVGIISTAPWIVGARPPGGSIALIAIVALGTSAAALALAWARAAQVIPAAVREVAALDQEILAHVERSQPSALEAGVVAAFLSRPASLVASKDAALLRRRYPSPYFMIPCGIIATWIAAATQPLSYLPWAGSFFGAILAYAIVMARRAQVEPIEIPRLAASLPISPGDLARAKNLMSALRIALIVVLAGIPLIVRAPDRLSAGVFVALASALALLTSLRRQSGPEN